MKPILILVACLLASFVDVQGQNSNESVPTGEKKVYTTQRIQGEPPLIDGKLNDACWQNDNWDGGFIQWIPNEGQSPTYPTYINILYDNKNVYVAIRAVDYEPDKINKKASGRDSFTGDMVGINFDSYHDYRTGFEFNVSAAGQKVDLLLSNPTNVDFNWDAVWSVKVGMEDTAWTAEFEIPLSQLRYSNEKEQVWGMHVWRWLDRKQEESDWEPQSSTGPGILYQFGTLKGISDLPKSRRIEIMPYALGKVNAIEKNAANPYAQHTYQPFGSIGLDAKFGLSSNFTADVTINPDFGQVESDPSVMNLTAFETFYEEKRPFFLEGRNIFSFDMNGTDLFYSRRIGQKPDIYPTLNAGEYLNYPSTTSILGAAKVSGKTANGLAIGILESLTNNEKALISDGTNERNYSVDPLTNYTVARVQKDFNEGTTSIGGMLTSTNRFLGNTDQFTQLNKAAVTGGIDLLHQWNDKEFYLFAKLLVSTVQGSEKAMTTLQNSSARYYQRPDAAHLALDSTLTRLSGQGGSIKIGKGSKGHWRYYTSLKWLSPGLELNDLGYMQISDRISNENSLYYFISESTGIVRSLYARISEENSWDYALNFQELNVSAAFDTQFLNLWSLGLSANYTPEAIDSRLLRGGYAMKTPSIASGSINVSSDYSKKAAVRLGVYYQQQAQTNASTLTIMPGVSYQPINPFKLTISANYSNGNNELQFVGHSFNNIRNSVLANIEQQTLSFTFRADYIITPELSIQYYGSPFASTGKFSSYKLITDPLADNYSNRFETIGNNLSNNETLKEAWGVDMPDFTFTQFRSNLVFRWEYQPGSKIYLVWANERTLYSSAPKIRIGEAFKGLNSVFPNNTILVKLNYWFSL